MSRNQEYSERLSEAGAARRQQILADALQTADRRRRARLVRQASVMACVAAGVFVAALVIATRELDRQSPSVPVGIEPPRPPESQPVVVPQKGRLLKPITPPPRTRPAPAIVVQILTAEDVKPRWEVLNDDQFLAALADAGAPSGLARINGKEVVVPVN